MLQEKSSDDHLPGGDEKKSGTFSGRFFYRYGG